jgi:aspartate racemase
MHLGLIGGIGPAATEFYYRLLARAHSAAGRRMELTIVNADARELIANMTAGAPDRQAEVFAGLARRLAAAGAEAVAVTSMSGHFCAAEFVPRSPLPVLSAMPALADALARRGVRRVGLLGTRLVMQSRVYGALSPFDVVLPPGDRLDATHDAYVAMATVGEVRDEHRRVFFDVGRALCRDHGAEVVILGGTDLFLAFEGQDCGFPTLDSARTHVEALARAMGIGA